MKHFFYICIAMLLLTLATSCEEENTQVSQPKNVDLKYLPGSWVMESYETAAQNGSGKHVTDTRLDESFAITIYEDMLFTLSGKGFLLAEGTGRIDVSRLEIGLNDYKLAPSTDLSGADQILLPIVTSKTLHIEKLEENYAELSLKYSETVTITARLKRVAASPITGKWAFKHGSTEIPDGYKDLRIECMENGSLACSATAGNTSGSYTYNWAKHRLSITVGEEKTEYDAVCTVESLRIAPLSHPETILHLTREK